MLSIKHLEAIPLNVPFYHERVSRHMHRALTHGERVHVYRVELSNGVIGYGENLSDESANIEQVIGQNAFACVNDDSIGFGIQMSLYDAIGKSVGVPVYQLIGPKVRERCPISWWDIDMPPEDWVAEVQESVKRGYTSAKLKARPWRDIFAQVDAVGNAVPADYRLDIDFNGFLRTANNAIPVLQQLDEHPNVAIYESPYYLGTDVMGAVRLQANVQKRIVEHFNESCLHARCCGGFVVGGGVNSLGGRTRSVLRLSNPTGFRWSARGLQRHTLCISVRCYRKRNYRRLRAMSCGNPICLKTDSLLLTGRLQFRSRRDWGLRWTKQR